jgi:hypothetical protein
VYYHVDSTGKRCPYSDADNSAISTAKANGAPAVRISDVVLPDGATLEFEVRFGENAVSKRLATPPPSAIIQVNLGSENTRVVVEGVASAVEGYAAKVAKAAGAFSNGAKETAVKVKDSVGGKIADLKAWMLARKETALGEGEEDAEADEEKAAMEATIARLTRETEAAAAEASRQEAMAKAGAEALQLQLATEKADRDVEQALLAVGEPSWRMSNPLSD